jgi:long-chain acyl-CoA synthetase
MDYDNCRSLPAMFFEQAARLGDKPFFWAKRDGPIGRSRWVGGARRPPAGSSGLQSIGIGRARVGLVSENGRNG